MKLIRWENETITPAHDSMQWDDGRIGILNGCGITHIGTNKLRIAAGYIVVLGRLIEVTETDINCEVSTSGTLNGQMILRIDLGSSTPLEIVTEASGSLTPLTQDENFNFDNGIYEVQLATYDINETTLTNLDVKLQTAPSLGAEIQQLNNNLTTNDGVPFRFGKDASGKFGYIIEQGGADTVIPFKTGAEMTAYNVSMTSRGTKTVALTKEARYAVAIMKYANPVWFAIDIYDRNSNTHVYQQMVNTTSWSAPTMIQSMSATEITISNPCTAALTMNVYTF